MADARQALGISRVGPQVPKDVEIPFLNAVLEAGSKRPQAVTRAYRGNPREFETPISPTPAQTLPPPPPPPPPPPRTSNAARPHPRSVRSAEAHIQRGPPDNRERTHTTANDQNRVTGEIVKARLEAMYELPPRGRRPPLPNAAYEYLERGEAQDISTAAFMARERPESAPPKPWMRGQIADTPANATQHR